MLDPQGPSPVSSVSDLKALRKVIDGPLLDIARRFSRLLADRWPHTALIIFTRECTGRPRKVAGPPEVVDRVTIGELDEIKRGLEPGGWAEMTAAIAGTPTVVQAMRDTHGTLLVLVPRASAGTFPGAADLAAVFGIVATSIRQQVVQASPDYLAESRAASIERARTTAELTATHQAALQAVLAPLRSAALDDAHARTAASDAAAEALLALRATRDAERELAEESASSAFARSRRELRSALRHHHARIEFVAPDKDGRPLPGEVAQAAIAMTRTAALAFAAQPTLTRLRVAWTRDSTSLCIELRDQESGALDSATLHGQLRGRANAFGAEVVIKAVPKWGSEVTMSLPLDAPPERPGRDRLARLNAREREVLARLVEGKRNRVIAAELGVTENTIKFHVTRVLRKLEVETRGEAAALGRALEGASRSYRGA
ncbi:helix-turn-helix transcriptional regulator [Nocardia otitidiscaviarum]|uniref:helix-turn-helix transcriptional regulator n=1 Tax=Nocardia otitidiscaviarum TaxID=1823 RepID=UPI0018958DC5|nr:helix-turn-helix transcriptional regulator [Nocardia otitidiscaviarum]MBF6180026.1 helix-turn-helix transcriptional regulator [Nocardia otitidiscaviarum]